MTEAEKKAHALLDALTEAFPLSFDDYPASKDDIANFRDALAARGLEVREIE